MGKRSRRKNKQTFAMPSASGRAAAASDAGHTNRESNIEGCGNDCPCFVCSKKGWVAGRGVCSEKRDKKDRSRVKKAQKRNQRRKLVMGDNLEERARRLVARLSSAEEAAKLLQYVNFLTRRTDYWGCVHNAICKHEERNEWQKIESKATSILLKIDRARSESGLDKELYIEHGIVHPCERLAFYNRAQARMRGLDDAQGAVDDLTETLSHYKAFLQLDYGVIDTQEVKILYNRAQCHLKLDNLDMAYEDLRACCSGLNMIGDENWTSHSSIPLEVVKSMLMVMAKQKVLSGVPRPFYTQDERDSIEKYLGLNAFYEDKYHCRGCGAKPSEVALHRCSGCMNIWFCGSACQKKAWRDGHKQACGEIPLICRDQDKAGVDADFEDFGGVTYMTTRGQPRALAKDPETGRYFDSLTNQNVYFFPSEKPIIPRRAPFQVFFFGVD